MEKDLEDLEWGKRSGGDLVRWWRWESKIVGI